MSERLSRVAEAIKVEVAQILQRELKDPRIGFVTVTRVTVTPDLGHATVYFSLLEGQSTEAPGAASSSGSHALGGVSGAASSSGSHGSPAETEAGLKSASGFVRRLLGERLRIRVTPEVSFRLDPSVAESIRISKLLSETRKEQEKPT